MVHFVMYYNVSILLILQGREPFVSAEGLEQLNRFLFVLGIAHVLYSCITVGLAMSKVHFTHIISNSIKIFNN